MVKRKWIFGSLCLAIGILVGHIVLTRAEELDELDCRRILGLEFRWRSHLQTCPRRLGESSILRT